MAGQPNSSWNTTLFTVEVGNFKIDSLNLIIGTLVIGAFIVVGVIGNSLAFVVFWKDNINTSASFLFRSLALVDTAFLVFSIPFYTTYPCHHSIECSEMFDNIYPYLYEYVRPVLVVARTASIWIVVLFAVNRYIAVCFPLKSLRWCTISKVKKQLAVVLLFSVLINIPIFTETFVMHDEEENPPLPLHSMTFATDEFYNIIYTFVFYKIVNMAMPLAILTVLNIRLMKALKTIHRNRMQMLSRREQHDNNATFVLVIVVVVFVLCQLPDFIFHVLWKVMGHNAIYVPASKIAVLWWVCTPFVVLNSAINFVIYAVFNKRFRHVLTQTVCGSKRLEVDRRRRGSTGRHPEVRHFNRDKTRPENGNDNVIKDTRF